MKFGKCFSILAEFPVIAQRSNLFTTENNLCRPVWGSISDGISSSSRQQGPLPIMWEMDWAICPYRATIQATQSEQRPFF